MSLFLTLAKSTNKVIRELLAIAITFVYIAFIPFTAGIIISFRMVTNTVGIIDLVGLIFAIIAYGIQMDLCYRFDVWLYRKLGIYKMLD